MQFRVVRAGAADPMTSRQFLKLPAITPLPRATVTRPLPLIEKAGVGFDADRKEVEGPLEALLGVVKEAGMTVEKMWGEAITENPAVGATEVWEFYNTTADAHSMHVHEVAFQVVNREVLVLDANGEVIQPIQLAGNPRPPESWENG